MTALRDASASDWIFATPLTGGPGHIALMAFKAGWEAAAQLASEYRAVCYSGNQKDGVEPQSFADLLRGVTPSGPENGNALGRISGAGDHDSPAPDHGEIWTEVNE